jgi:hypothetical protein
MLAPPPGRSAAAFPRSITLLAWAIVPLALAAAGAGILTEAGPGPFDYTTIRGETVRIYGRGLYRHMSADVAIQGVAQDYVTLLMGLPALLVAWWGARRGSLRHHLLLGGVLGYFFVTYLFYTAMGMYNALFLVYVTLLGLSFFGLLATLLSVRVAALPDRFSARAPVRFTGGFLIFNAGAIALLWLSVVVPPLLDGSVYPATLQHYTTLIVQGFDLGLLLPLSVVSGWLLVRRRPLGYLAGTVYIVFLAILMTALVAKLLAMAKTGVSVVPAIFIIPVFMAIAWGAAYRMLKSVGQGPGKR